MHVYFDMDGTIADFYGVEGWLDAIRAEDTRPYECAATLGNIERLAALCAAYGATVGVISWLARGSSPDYDKAVRRAKKAWLADNFPWATEVHIIKHGSPKQFAAKAKTDAILVDDECRNCEKWTNESKGYYAIRADNAKQIERDLAELLPRVRRHRH